MSSNPTPRARRGVDGRGAGADLGDTNRRCGLFRSRRRYGGGVVCGTGRMARGFATNLGVGRRAMLAAGHTGRFGGLIPIPELLLPRLGLIYGWACKALALPAHTPF